MGTLFSVFKMAILDLFTAGFLLTFHFFCYISGIEVTGPPNCTYAALSDTAVLSCLVTDHALADSVRWSKIENGLNYFIISSSGSVARNQVDSIDDGSDYTLGDSDVLDFNSTRYWANMSIATVNINDTGHYSCWAGSIDDGGQLLLAVDANSIYVEFNGTVYQLSKSNIGAFEQKSYTLSVTAENSLPETTFELNIIDGSKPAEIVNLDYSSTNDGSCEPFTSTGIATYDLTMIESEYFTIRFTATNEITGQSTIIDLNGTISADNTLTSFTISTGAIIGIVVAVVVFFCILGGIGCCCYMKGCLCFICFRRPFEVRVIESTDTELKITWTGHTGGCSHTFAVEYRIFGSEKAWMITADVDKPPVTLTCLQPLTEYEIRVKIKDILLDSSSEPITARTTVQPNKVNVDSKGWVNTGKKHAFLISNDDKADKSHLSKENIAAKNSHEQSLVNENEEIEQYTKKKKKKRKSSNTVLPPLKSEK